MTREEAIEIVKKHGISADGTKFESALRELIPELAESEDERIRKEMLAFFKNFYETGTWKSISDVNTWLAYLEKQKEPEGMITVSKEAWDENAKDSFERGIKVGMIRQQKEQWLTAKINGEPIPTENYSVNIPLAEWSEEDEKMLDELLEFLNFRDPEHKYSNWLKSFRPQYHGDVTMTEAYKMGLEAGKASHWKPSEEQMRGLAHAINLDVYDAKRYGLDSLYSDLKKLM